jgi:hypothetical protein
MQCLSFGIFEETKKVLLLRDLSSPAAVAAGVRPTFAAGHEAETGYIARVFLAGATAGALLTPITCPIIMIKLQQQAATKKNVVDAAREIFKTRGIAAFYKGAWGVEIDSTVESRQHLLGPYVTVVRVVCRARVVRGPGRVRARVVPGDVRGGQAGALAHAGGRHAAAHVAAVLVQRGSARGQR